MADQKRKPVRGEVVIFEGALEETARPLGKRARRLSVVVGNDVGSALSKYAIVVSLTIHNADNPPLPVTVFISKDAETEAKLRYDSVADCGMIFTIPQDAIIDRLGKLAPSTMDKLDDALKVSLGLKR